MNFIDISKNDLKRLKEIKDIKSQLDAEEKDLRKRVMANLDSCNLTKYSDDIYTVQFVGATESISIDTRALQKKDPIMFGQLVEDYPKTTKRAESVRISFKED